MKSQAETLSVGGGSQTELLDARSASLDGRPRIRNVGLTRARLCRHAVLVAGWLAMGPLRGDIHLEETTITINENAELMIVAIVRDASTSQGPAAVDYATGDVTALAGEDYVAVSGRLQFVAGETRATVAVQILNDTLREDREEFLFTIRNATGSFLGQPRELAIWIEDNDPGVRFAEYFIVVDEEVGSAELTILRGDDGSLPVSVDYMTVPGSALPGEDYRETSGTVTFGPHETRQTVSITIVNNGWREAQESFEVRLFNASAGSGLAEPSSALVRILDNDRGTRFAEESYWVLEDAGEVLIPVWRGNDGDFAFNVEVTTSGSAVYGEDHLLEPVTLTFLPGEMSKTLSMPILNDGRHEGLEVLQLLLRNPTEGAVLDGRYWTASVWIEDNDPGIGFSVDHCIVPEDQAEVSLVVVRGADVDLTPVNLVYATEDATATAGADYVGGVGSLDFSSGQTAAAITIPILNDALCEGIEWFTVTLTDPTSSQILGMTSSITVSIADNDPGIHFEPGVVSVGENAGSVVLTVHRGNDREVGPFSIDYFTQDHTAVAGLDYVAAQGRLEFGQGESSKPLIVGIMNDALSEITEAFLVVLANPPDWGSLGLPKQVTVSIQDNDPGVHFSNDWNWVAEDGGAAVLTVWRGNDVDTSTFTVDYSTESGSATGDLDYVISSGQIVFAGGQMEQRITVPILNDGVREDEETFVVILSKSSGGADLGRPSEAVVTIGDNDPGIGFVETWVGVDEASGQVPLTVIRGNDVKTDAFSVEYVTRPGDATPGLDYDAIAGQLDFAAGEQQRTLTLPILNDGLTEPYEWFTVMLRNPTGSGDLGQQAQATVAIYDNDPGIHFADGWVAVPEDGGQVVLKVLRGNDVETGSFTVDYATQPDSATAGQDYVATSGTLEFAAGTPEQTLAISLLNDALTDPQETFTVTLSNPTGPVTLGHPAQAEIFIEDNEVGVHFAPGSLAVYEGAGTLEVKVLRGHDGDFPVSVDYATYGGSATAGTDYQEAAGTLNFEPGQAETSFQLEILDDRKWEGDEGFNIVLSNVVGPVLLEEYASRFALILDDDPFQWQPRQAPPDVSLGTWRELAYANGTYVVTSVTSDGWTASFTLLRSDDLQHWTPTYSGQAGWRSNLYLEASEDRFLLSSGATLLTSTDGTAWTLAAPPAGAWFNDLAAGTDRFVAVGQGRIYASSDGISWESQLLPEGIELYRAHFSGNHFVVEGDDWINAVPVAFSSVDGEAWHQQTEAEWFPWDHWLRCGPLELGVGGGQLHIWQDGDRWLSYSLGENASVSKVTMVQGRLIAAGWQPGLLLISSPLMYLEQAHWLPSGQLSLQVAGAPGTSGDLEISCDLRQWETLDTLSLTQEKQVLLLTPSLTNQACFYRLSFPYLNASDRPGPLGSPAQLGAH